MKLIKSKGESMEGVKIEHNIGELKELLEVIDRQAGELERNIEKLDNFKFKVEIKREDRKWK